MTGAQVQFLHGNDKRNGTITEIVNHDDGDVSYEILAGEKNNQKIHYLAKDEFTILKQSPQLSPRLVGGSQKESEIVEFKDKNKSNKEFLSKLAQLISEYEE